MIKIRRTRKNLEFEITPEVLDIGEHWISVTLKNVGSKHIRHLDIKLNSKDTLGLNIKDSSKYLPLLPPGDEIILYFKVNVYFSTPIYASIISFIDDEPFYWETPLVTIRITSQVAEITSLFTIREISPEIGDSIKSIISIMSKQKTDNLSLEVWMETPDREIEEIEVISLDDKLEPHKLKDYTTQFDAKMKGTYTVRAQLFKGIKKLSSKTDHILIN